MQEYTIPEHAKIPANNEPGFVLYPYQNYLGEFVWGHEFWRSGDADTVAKRLLSLQACQQKHEGKEPGDKVRLTDQQFKHMLPLVLQQGEKVPPHLVAPLTPYMIAITQAVEVEEDV